jgi:ribosome biogenesis SPOUT family RNA methylase Rps3
MPPLVDRTSELRKKGYQGRRLGPVQMTTDTAVRVTRIVVQDRSTTNPALNALHARL